MASYEWLKATLLQSTTHKNIGSLSEKRDSAMYYVTSRKKALQDIEKGIKGLEKQIEEIKKNKNNNEKENKTLKKKLEEDLKYKIELQNKTRLAIQSLQEYINGIDEIEKAALSSKEQQRRPEQAEEDFISAANWSWNTEDVLYLMKEGLVPTNLVTKILNKACCINDFFSLFNGKCSLKHLIGSKNIQILSCGDECIALDPSFSEGHNKEKIQEFFKKKKDLLEKGGSRLNVPTWIRRI